MKPKVETRFEVRVRSSDVSALYVHVRVDGIDCGENEVTRGYHADVRAYVAGEIDREEMQTRCRQMKRDAIRWLEENPPHGEG